MENTGQMIRSKVARYNRADEPLNQERWDSFEKSLGDGGTVGNDLLVEGDPIAHDVVGSIDELLADQGNSNVKSKAGLDDCVE